MREVGKTDGRLSHPGGSDSAVLFDSVREWLEECKTTRRGKDLMDDPERNEWAEGTVAEARERALAGDPETARKVADQFAALENRIEAPRRGWMPAPLGAFPVPGDALAGHPLAMRRPVDSRTTAAPITVAHDLTLWTRHKAELVRKRGIATLALVNHLSRIRPVQLVCCAFWGKEYGGRHIFGFAFPMGHAPVNLSVACGIMASPPLYRHQAINFAVDTVPTMPDGAPLPHDKYAATAKRLLGLKPTDLLIRAANADEVTKDPEAWINQSLDQLLNARSLDR